MMDTRTTPTRTCVLDFETRSALDLRKTNAVVYAKHPTTEVWLTRYAYDDDPETIHRIPFGSPMPDDLREHVEAGGVVSAHNAGFEHAIWNHLLAVRYGWAHLPLGQLDDTAARAARCGLPRSLDKAAKSLRLAQEKDSKGAQQMKRMARPRKVTRAPAGEALVAGMDEQARADPATFTFVIEGDTDETAEGVLYEWWNVPERVERLGAYCDQDVRTQMMLHQTLPPLPDTEWEVWQATMRANARGIQLDMPFVHEALRIIDQRMERYAERLLTLTDGQVKKHTDLNGMKQWLAGQGYELDSLDKNVVADLLADPATPDKVRTVVGIRAEAGKSSVAKLPAMVAHADENGLMYDQLVYYGATATGRWSGSGTQVQNYPSRGPVGYRDAEWHIAHTLSAGPEDAADAMEWMHDASAIEVLSMCLRGAIRARDGQDVVAADFSNIEGRVAAWLGGEDWKLAAFRAYDAGTGPDLYKVAAGGMLGVAPEDVDKTMRNAVGKVSELALQFQGGVGAFLSMAKVYRVEIGDHWDAIRAALDPEITETAVEAYETRGKQAGLTDRRTWIAAESVKIAWRRRHPGIVQAWYDCEDAAVGALRRPGEAHFACDRRLGFLCRHINGVPFLLMRLPSGRCIHYANATLRNQKTPWGDTKQAVVFDKVEQGRVIRSQTYAGDIYQGSVQGGARDLMAGGWLNVERAGYRPLFSVHDEMVCEYPAGQADLADYERRLCELPDWAAGMPVTAAGYIAKRFRKD